VASPILANIYLHYVFDLWVNVWREKYARGEVVVIRYADDRAPRAQKAERLSSA
jgi:retron-type reverse transcriptase